MAIDEPARWPWLLLLAGWAGAALLGILAAARLSLGGLWEPDFGVSYSMPITANREAQYYFDAGLMHMYGFNKHEAHRAFEEAVASDADCAMCHWGVAYACGPTANDGANVDGRKGFVEAQHARRLSDAAASAGRPLSPVETALIDAMLVRYTTDGSLAEQGWRAYAERLLKLRTSLAQPNDDVDTFYADQLMCIVALKYYEDETMETHGPLRPDAAVAREVLEGVLNRTDNPLAMHLYIHIMEPLVAGDSELRLGERVAERLSAAIPRGSGHLLHMPGHLFNRIGRFSDAVDANIRAYEADEEYRQHGARPYIAGHNLQFLVWAAEMDGQRDVALKYGRLLGASGYMPWRWAPLATLVRYGDFDEVVAEVRRTGCLGSFSATCHYAHGLALAATGDIRGAESALEALHEALRLAPPDCGNYLQVTDCLANKTLAARVALLRGEAAVAVQLLQQGVVEEALVPYDEPPPWHYPTRHCLAATLLHLERFQEAKAVLHKDLEIWPGNAWSLQGLADVATAQGRTRTHVKAFLKQVDVSWQRSDRSLTSSCMSFALDATVAV